MAQLQIYKETQEELTSELSDFKEKYREVVDILHDTQCELRAAKKRSYPGMGQHKVSGMFDGSTKATKESKNEGKREIWWELETVVQSVKIPPLFIQLFSLK